MSIFICEKCGKLDNSGNGNNYWAVQSNKFCLSEGKEILIPFKDEYFNTHACCGYCCEGIEYIDGSGVLQGNKYNTISDKPYYEIEDFLGEGIENYEFILKRDKERRKQNG